MVVCVKRKAVCRRKDRRKIRCFVNTHLSSSPSGSFEQCVDDAVPPITERPVSPMSPDPPHVCRTRVPVAPERRVDLELLVGSVLKRPFNKICRYLQQLDLDNDFDVIKELVLHFSLKIYGLPECPTEDLPLAVYFFIEEYLGIQSKFQSCVALCEGGDSQVIGVVFETIEMKYNVLEKNTVLEGTEVRLMDNKDLQWIMDAL